MKKLAKRAFNKRLSLYADGMLSGQAKILFEEYLRGNPDAAKDLESLTAMKKLLAGKRPLPKDGWFWSRLSPRLDEPRAKGSSLSPFSKKKAPLGIAAMVAVIGMVGVIGFQQREPLLRYFSEKKDTVKEAYENTLVKGTVLPFFTSLNKDQVLQFTLFGILPMDAEAKTALRIDESKEHGYRIEVARNMEKLSEPVSVKKFCADIGATPLQRRIVDSILAYGGRKIQLSVLTTEDHGLAIHEELARLNREMVSTIAASLELPQRVRFQKYLEVRHAPFAVVASQVPPTPPAAILERIEKGTQSNRFIVITQDTCAVSQLKVDLDDIRRAMERSPLPPPEARAERLLRRFAAIEERQGGVVNQFKVFSDSDFFSIQIQDMPFDPFLDSMELLVAPRVAAKHSFRYEIRRTPRELENGFSLEFGDSVKVKMLHNQGRSKRNPGLPPIIRRQGRDLDSLIMNSPRQKVSRPKKRFDSPIEL